MWFLRWVSHESDVYVYGCVIWIERFKMACFSNAKSLRAKKKKEGIFRREIC